MNDKIVTVFGGGGFLGRYVVQALLHGGARVRVAERAPKNAHRLKAQANLGQIAFAAADIMRPETLGPVVEGSDAVINLVGSFNDMERVHVSGAGNIAQAAADAGVQAMVHVSAIGADHESPSLYGRTKGMGEAAVRAIFPAATIVRPSIIFGREDAFINRFAGLVRALPILPVLGGSAKVQPVFAGDVGRAVVAALDHPGQTFELGGPQTLTMSELNQWIAERTGRSPFMLELPDEISSLIATLTGWLPGAPITRDQWIMLKAGNVANAQMPGLSALGIEATPLDTLAPGWLTIYRKHGRFGVAA